MLTPRTTGRSVAVRLTEIPIQTRRARGKALYEAAVADHDLMLAAQLHAAIEEPSERIYWVPERAVRKVLR